MKPLLLAALLLTACSPVTLTPSNLAQAQADIAGQVAATGTAERVENRAATATGWAQSSEATRIYIEGLQVQATRQSYDETAQAQADNSTATAIVTAEHAIALSTQRAAELAMIEHNNAIRLITTQAAQKEKDVTRYSDGWFNIFLCGSLIIAAIAIILTLFIGSKFLPPVITALGENNSRVIMARGIGQSLNGNGHRAVIHNHPTSQGGVPDVDVKIIEARAVETEDAAMTDLAASLELSHLHPDNRDVLRGLQHMAALVGGHSEKLPSSAKRIEHGLYNEIYQPLINALNKSNDVGAREGKSGIFVNSLKWKDLDDLMNGITDGRVDLSNRVMWNGNKRPAEL
ncbi:hypothetical protein [Caudoviricetes sp.]|nr:hypothetical protein [Caudoviricetes sp.]UOF81105.1 hypothetical protein [Caudoviricetes sp.]UOF82214.1 hypothetical protein [Caudoviricetes sp.]UOF82450.1 hypothetical protein [Caudoviricetes sp.]UOF82649.1 hypothetical protein [Caudoviricetes sp.]